MVTDGLIAWYKREKRDLPWRRDREAYHVWVSEIMLQQTRVEAVIPYYERFLHALPTVEELAKADEAQLLKLWEGLGYYSRVRNMQKAAKDIVLMGGFPKTAKELKKLSGFGEYTSGAVASIAFGERVAAVDGNVLRVWARMERVGESIKMPSVRRRCAQDVLDAMPADCDAGDYTQALMELGATVCTPRSPKCKKCPLQAHCGAYEADEAEDYPIAEAKMAKAVEEFDVHLIVRDGKVLVRQRPKSGLLAGMWEFPHEAADEQSVSAAVVQRRLEEAGLTAQAVGPEQSRSDFTFTHRVWHLRAWAFDLQGGKIEAPYMLADAQELRALPMASVMEEYRILALKMLENDI